MMSQARVRVVSTLEEVQRQEWDALSHGDSPFTKWGYLAALERSGSVGPGTGWLPRYVLLEWGGGIIGACPSYVKTDSYGEYIFDWAWAQASERGGIPYYPKLVVAVPFTPATGRRFLTRPNEDETEVTRALVAGLHDLVEDLGLSGLHILFCTEQEAAIAGSLGLRERASFQFHWINRGYGSFDDFLGALKSRKRKQVKKERARAHSAVDRIDFVYGDELTKDDFAALERFYRCTVADHGGFAYLQPGFFQEVAHLLPKEMVFARARQNDQCVAGALFFETPEALYGRYWGADLAIDSLHFELAYYSAIERCIARNTKLFEAGAQGSHKLMRGLMPRRTYSCHSLRHPGLSQAVRGFLEVEAAEVHSQMAYLESCGPYSQRRNR